MSSGRKAEQIDTTQRLLTGECTTRKGIRESHAVEAKPPIWAASMKEGERFSRQGR